MRYLEARSRFNQINVDPLSDRLIQMMWNLKENFVEN